MTNSIKKVTIKMHKEGEYRRPPSCPKCKRFTSIKRIHNCEEGTEKMIQAKLKNPTRYWLGKKRPGISKTMSISSSRTYEERMGKEKANELKHNASKRMLGNKFAKGSPSWNKGLTRGNSKKTDEMQRKRSKTLKKKWSENDYRESQITAQLSGKKSSYEIRFELFIKKYNLPFKFVGDGKTFIGGKVPDFIHTKGERLLIEVYDTYHKNHYYGSEYNYMHERGNHFLKSGWRTIFLNENELKNEQYMLNKITDIV